MTRLGRLDRGARRLLVAQLADQDDVGVLAQHAPERLGVRLGVEPDLALVDDAAPVVVDDLDRILDGDDVLLARAVDPVDHRRERRRLARAGRARDQDQPAVLLGQLLDAGREPELLEARHDARHVAEGERDRAPLAKAVDAEAADLARDEGGVELARLVEVLALRRGALGDEAEHVLEVGVGDHALVERHEKAVDAGHRRRVDLEVNVAPPKLDQTCKQIVEVHAGAPAIGGALHPLEEDRAHGGHDPPAPG